jgi:UDP-N-acetylmuramyl pentapeptide synthase
MNRFFKKCVIALLLLEARMLVRKYKPRIIAVTGSVGKTSTKDAIYEVLSSNTYVRKSEKSFNSEIGVPLTILGCPNAWHNPLRWIQNLFHGLLLILFRSRYPEWLVLEIGADKPNDIRSIAAWLPVDIAVITRLPDVPVHVEFFTSPEEVLEEKASLIEALKPGGTLVLYGDEERARALKVRAQQHGASTVLFGLLPSVDVQGIDFMPLMNGGQWPVGMRFNVLVHGTEAQNRIALELHGAVGSHVALSLVAAVSVGVVLGVDPDTMGERLKGYQPPSGRMRLIPGLKDSLIIDDTYNSSPAAAHAALEALTLLPRGTRKIVVLGDMLELGRHSVEEHRKLGAAVAASADILATIGPRARDIAQGALDNGMLDDQILQYEDARTAGKELKNLIGPGNCILVKGSQSVRMERTIEELMLEPEHASELLVRQDTEWKQKQ